MRALVISRLKPLWLVVLVVGIFFIPACASSGSTFVPGPADQNVIQPGVWDFRTTVHSRQRFGPPPVELRGEIFARGDGRFDITFRADGQPFRCRDLGLAPRRGVREVSGRLVMSCRQLRMELRPSEGRPEGEAYLTYSSGGAGRGTLTFERRAAP